LIFLHQWLPLPCQNSCFFSVGNMFLFPGTTFSLPTHFLTWVLLYAFQCSSSPQSNNMFHVLQSTLVPHPDPLLQEPHLDLAIIVTTADAQAPESSPPALPFDMTFLHHHIATSFSPRLLMM
jgi:hypothetical protein